MSFLTSDGPASFDRMGVQTHQRLSEIKYVYIHIYIPVYMYTYTYTYAYLHTCIYT